MRDVLDLDKKKAAPRRDGFLGFDSCAKGAAA